MQHREQPSERCGTRCDNDVNDERRKFGEEMPKIEIDASTPFVANSRLTLFSLARMVNIMSVFLHFTFAIHVHTISGSAEFSIRCTQVVWLPLHSQESRLLTNCLFYDSLHQRKGRNFAKGTNRTPCSRTHSHFAWRVAHCTTSATTMPSRACVRLVRVCLTNSRE